METILDDEFVIQMDDTPPFSWIRQTPSRFMTCNVGRKLDSLAISAIGTPLIFAEMARDIIGGKRIKIRNPFSLSPDETNCLITYSGEVRGAIAALKETTNKGIVISSGGAIKSVARSKGWDYIPLPKGYAARFLLPEILGCMLTLFGRGFESTDLESFLEQNAPSEITSENVSKQIALRLSGRSLVIFYDELSAGLANYFLTNLKTNAGLEANIVSVEGGKEHTSKADANTVPVSFSRQGSPKDALNIGGFPYDCSTVDGYVKNAVIAQMSSLYLGLLRAHEIELLDNNIE